MEFWGSPMYTIMPSTNNDILTSSFPIPLNPFCCLIALTRTLSMTLNTYGESGQPCQVSDFIGITSIFSLLGLILATGLLYIAFTMFSYGS